MKNLSFILFFCISLSHGQTQNTAKLDSLKELSLDTKIRIDKRIVYAENALDLARSNESDSILLNYLKNLSVIYVDAGYSLKSRPISRESISMAKKLKDTLSLASTNFNLANSFYTEFQTDSAYYYYTKALGYYRELKMRDKVALALTNIADIQDTEQDFTGSEENAIKALRLFETFPKNEYNLDYLWILNNLLGIVSMKLGNLDKSLEYHSEAQRIADQMQEGYYNSIFSQNNIAFVYRKQESFNQAIDIYTDLADARNKYDDYDPTFYPLVLENLAYTKLLGGGTDFDKMESTFKEAYRISDSLDDPLTILAVAVDYSKFYLNRKQRDSSLKYATIAYNLSKEVSANEILLDALKVLSELKPGREGKAYLKEYISLSDSLLKVERNVRNKFARIEFETDKITEENEKMSAQRKWLFIVSLVLLISLIFLYIIVNQRAKNKELKFEKEQQKVNEEIYNLMLSQQDKVDEARANEKKRISQDMHDGILGRLFGTRLSLDSLNLSEGKDAVMNRANYINELKDIENDIRKISHDLNTDFIGESNFMLIILELIEKQTNAYGLSFKFEHDDDIAWEILDNKTKINIYRIIQETLQNIYKHAESQKVEVVFELRNGDICLRVSDDGKGFDINKSRKGIGIKNITSRAAEFNGEVIFESEKERGTTVKIIIPQKIAS